MPLLLQLFRFLAALLEFLNAAHGVYHLFLSGIEGVAGGANLHLHLLLSSADGKRVAARACHRRFRIPLWVNVFFHNGGIVKDLCDIIKRLSRETRNTTDNMSTVIAHLDLDCFFAQVEERENPRFRGKPVVVGADPRQGRGRGVVSTANYEAREYGIHSAQPVSEAWCRCPHAVFLPVNMEAYQAIAERIFALAEQYADTVERVSVDEAYLDMSAEQCYEAAKRTVEHLRTAILRKEQLTCSAGIGPNKLIAKLATEAAKPDGVRAVRPGEVSGFISAHEARDMPGIGDKTAQRLFELFGAYQVADVQNIPEKQLVEVFGKRGAEMYRTVRGAGSTRVVSYEPPKSIGREHTFAADTTDSEALFARLEELVMQTYRDLQEERAAFRTVTVKCRFAGFETRTHSNTLEAAAQEKTLLLREAKWLLLCFIAEYPGRPVRLLGVRCSNLDIA